MQELWRRSKHGRRLQRARLCCKGGGSCDLWYWLRLLDCCVGGVGGNGVGDLLCKQFVVASVNIVGAALGLRCCVVFAPVVAFEPGMAVVRWCGVGEDVCNSFAAGFCYLACYWACSLLVSACWLVGIRRLWCVGGAGFGDGGVGGDGNCCCGKIAELSEMAIFVVSMTVTVTVLGVCSSVHQIGGGS